ncbi:MAG TPA: tetratricopeptide repeat protein, partial [Ktedonobacterales bacterium]|nr:tetratricopeptide repeat protein [Ktedonobacterales bacterium]
GTAACLNNLGLLDMVLNPTDEGRAQLEEALELRRQLGDHQQAAEVLGNLGVWHRKRGEFAAAASRIEEALEFGRQHRDRWLVGQSQANLASIYLAQARMDRAHEAAREAVACARAVGDELLECEALDYLGMIQRELGRPAEAEAAHERAVALARRAGLAVQEAYALASLALDRPSQDARLLKDNLRKAIKLASTSSSFRLLARLHEATGRASLAGGDIVQATQNARIAIEAATTGHFAQSIATAELLLADCLLAEENDSGLEEASQAAGRAIAAASPFGLLEPLWQGHAMVAEVGRRRGRRALEREALAEAAEALQRVVDTMTDEPTRLAYLGAPRRAEVMRRASALAVRRRAEAGDGSPERALSAIYEIASIINSMSDLDTMLDRVLDVGLGIVGGERGLITLLDDSTGEQRIAAARDLEEETVRDALEYSRSIVKEAAAGRIIVALDASSDDRFKNFKSVGLYAIKSLLCVPMKIHDNIIGTVYVDSRRQGAPFDEQDLRFLEAFSNLAAGAVQQARLQERLARENVYLMREAGERNRYQNIIGKNVKMQAV